MFSCFFLVFLFFFCFFSGASDFLALTSRELKKKRCADTRMFYKEIESEQHERGPHPICA